MVGRTLGSISLSLLTVKIALREGGVTGAAGDGALPAAGPVEKEARDGGRSTRKGHGKGVVAWRRWEREGGTRRPPGRRRDKGPSYKHLLAAVALRRTWPCFTARRRSMTKGQLEDRSKW